MVMVIIIIVGLLYPPCKKTCLNNALTGPSSFAFFFG